MNFFKRQDEARRHTALLILYLLIAVVLIVVAVNAVVYAAVVLGNASPMSLSAWLKLPWWPLISLATLLVILMGSVVRFLTLRGGGRAVADLMGARPVTVDSRHPLERRYVNVVEEMSIASGTPVPDLYVMDREEGINAFVAGYRPTEAVMVVTRGALETLTRDELQGVVGHEFSHILNGDMRINVRLIAILAGVLTLGVLGRLMMRSMTRTSGIRRSPGGGRSAQGQLVVVALGLGLFVIGYIGLFFGRLIKAAVSRQREYLADASSVQFTRNPRGIAGALWKIKSHVKGALLSSEHAEETSHMCFGQSMKVRLSTLLATHPPIDDRIRRVDPHFEVKMAAERREAPSAPGVAMSLRDEAMGFSSAGGESVAAQPTVLAGSVGNPTPEHVDYAVALHRAIPELLLDAVHDPGSAPLVVYALLLGDVAEERARIARALIAHETKSIDDSSFGPLCREVDRLDIRFRLPLLDLAAPALRGLSTTQKEKIVEVADKLVQIDRKVTLFEFVLLTLLKKQLKRVPESTQKIRFRRFDPVLPEIRVLLTLMARTGARNAREAERAFSRAMRSFTNITLPQADEAYCQLEAMEGVLAKLSALSPLLKGSLLSACADCLLHDGKITPQESELLRAVSEALDCPMPPLIAGNSRSAAA